MPTLTQIYILDGPPTGYGAGEPDSPLFTDFTDVATAVEAVIPNMPEAGAYVTWISTEDVKIRFGTLTGCGLAVAQDMILPKMQLVRWWHNGQRHTHFSAIRDISNGRVRRYQSSF